MFFQKKVKNVDPLIIEKYEQIFYIKNINQGDIVFDVGANNGELTLLFSKFVGLKGCVHAFEPTPSTFQGLLYAIKNFNRANVILNNKAVSDKSGHIILNVYEDSHASWNTIANRPLQNYGIIIKPPTPVKLPCVSVDDYCFEKAIEQIDLLKIDVEGAELRVLEGASRMFSEKKIKLCVFEFGQTFHDMGNSASDLVSFFNKHGYAIENVFKKQEKFPVNPKTNFANFSIHFAKPL